MAKIHGQYFFSIFLKFCFKLIFKNQQQCLSFRRNLNYQYKKRYRFLRNEKKLEQKTFSSLKTIDARFARSKKNNLSLLRSSIKSPQNFSTNLLFLRNNLSRSETSQNFKQTLSTLWQTWKTLCYKNFTKNFALLRKTNSVNLHGLCPIYYWLQNTQQCKTIQNSTSQYNL